MLKSLNVGDVITCFTDCNTRYDRMVVKIEGDDVNLIFYRPNNHDEYTSKWRKEEVIRSHYFMYKGIINRNIKYIPF